MRIYCIGKDYFQFKEKKLNGFVIENNNTSEMKLSGNLKVKVYKIFPAALGNLFKLC